LDTGERPMNYPRGLEISTSTDGENWTIAEIVSIIDSMKDYHFESLQPYRFLKLEVTGESKNLWGIYDLTLHKISGAAIAERETPNAVKFSSNVIEEGFFALTDKNSETLWSTIRSQEEGDYLMLEFPEEVEYNNIIIDTGNDPMNYPRGLSISTSLDGEEWTVAEIISVLSGETDYYFDNITNEPYRFMKLEITISSKWSWRIYDVELDKTDARARSIDNSIVFTSNINNNGFFALRDKNPDTLWVSEREQLVGDYIMIEFAAVVEYNNVILDTGKATSDFPRGLRIQTSLDGENWNTAPLIWAEKRSDFCFISEPYRFLKLELFQPSKWWWSINEIYFTETKIE